MVENPRKEAAENDLRVSNASFIALGLEPTTLEEGLLEETVEIAGRYADRFDSTTVAAASIWTKDQHAGVVTEAALLAGQAQPAA